MSDIEVLIVEDDHRIARINQKFTENVPGYVVIGVASSISEGKELLEIIEPDLVLLDIFFPEESGLSLLWHLRENYKETDVMMITAAKEIEAVQEALRGGAIDYIIKPVIFDRFKQTLEKFKKTRGQMNHQKVVSQEDVDHLFTRQGTRATVSTQVVPKGIDPLTLSKLTEVLVKHTPQGMTAEEVGSEMGCSRTTARRYLEYMVSLGKVDADLSYGTVGRPERRYHSIE
ncbi:response regulator [Bacillus hwajinpoensis]|uniref:Transcriptional regulatory protein n=1 Tax=Guptibacillus hwajinpoensis TaxID=208199 RepID=A0A845ERP3_9BACL|nr:response regulator [Pseudalkalibacillus hwajinpoensis]MYL62087.1 response regulator [Pseudalkalibacillus hwajinpoensis]